MVRLPFDDHLDRRGFVVNPLEGSGDTGVVTNCHAFSINPGCSRGGHHHPGRNEKVLLLSGSVTLVTDKGAEEFCAPALLELEPGEFHTFRCDAEAPAAVLCWSDRST